MSTTIPLTKHGADQLRKELHYLKTVERPSVISSISEARAHGDLSENAEYDAAKERQSFIETRIIEIEAKLSIAQIIDPLKIESDGRVVFGATIDLKDLELNQKVRYQIVGDDEANIEKGLISISSPFARAIIGKLVGDFIIVEAPIGMRKYKIIQIQYI